MNLKKDEFDPESQEPSAVVTARRRGWHRFLPFRLVRIRGRRRVQIYPKLLVLCGASLSAFVYVSLGLALFLNDTIRHGYDEISLFDRLYPPRWEHYRTSRGESYIRQGLKLLEEGDFSSAFHRIRVGLNRAPAHREGRLTLAQMFVVAGQAHTAEKLLLNGAEFHSGDATYLRDTCAFLFRRQSDEEIISLAMGILEDEAPPKDLDQLLTIAAATAGNFRGRFEFVEDLLIARGLQDSTEAKLLLNQIAWHRGYRELALLHVEDLATRFPEVRQLYRVQLEWLRELDRHDEARRLALVRSIKDPTWFLPRIDLLYAYDTSNQSDLLVDEVDAFLRDFSDDESAILTLGDFAANTGNTEIADLVLAHAKNMGLSISGPALMAVESRIVAGRYGESVDMSREFLETHPEWEAQLAPVFNGLQAIAHFAIGDGEAAQLYLDNFLALRNVRSDNLVAVSQRLEAVGAAPQARLTLERAIAADPLNQAALFRLIELDIADRNATALPANIQKLTTMRRPPLPLLRSARERLGGDRFLFIENREELLDWISASADGQNQPAIPQF